MKNKRSDSDYEIEAVSKAMKVFEALEGANFEPVNVATIMKRTGLSRYAVEWNLKTFRLRGWAMQNEQGKWTIGKKFVRFAISATRHESEI